MYDTDERIATILENISDAFLEFDNEWHFTYVNHRAELLLQKTREALLGRNVWEEFSDAVGGIFEQKYQEAVTTQQSVQFEDYYASTATWFEVRVYPSKNGVSVYFHDITRRKQAEQEREHLLRQVEAERTSAEAHTRQVNALLANISEGIIIADPQGTILLMNEVAVQIHDYRQPQDYQRNLTDFSDTFALHYTDGRIMPVEEWPLSRVLRGETVMDYKVQVTRLNSGVTQIWSYNGGLIYDEQGATTLAMLTLRNITMQKEAEDRLRASEERFRLLCDNAPIGIMISNNDILIYMNQTFVSLFGYENEAELLGKPFLELVAPASREKILQHIAQRVRGEAGPTSYETTALRKDNSTFTLWVDVGRMPLNDDIVTIKFVTDITERKEAEQRKDDFLSMASHELRTPITSVKAYTQILQRTFEKEGKQEPILYLSRMDTQINKLTKLIVNLLDVSRMQANKLVFAEETFDFDTLVHETIENIQQTTPHHSIQVDGSIERPVVGDKDRLGQVLFNLLTNAIKYSPRNNIVLVRLSTTDEQLTVQIQDFGIGIPKHQQAKIFERFYRVYDNNDTTYPGLGIGLYVAQEIIVRHNGTLSVESVEGEGSTFSFSLPFFQNKNQATTPQ